MIYALATRFGTKEVALIPFQVINEGQSIIIPPYLTEVGLSFSISSNTELYKQVKPLVESLLRGECIDFRLNDKRWFIAPLPRDYQNMLRDLVVDWL